MAKRRTVRRQSDYDRERRSSRSTSRRRTTGYRRRRAQPLRFRMDPSLRRGIVGLVLLALGVIGLLTFLLGPASLMWQLFGIGGIVVAIGLGLVGVLILWGEMKGEARLEWNDLLGGILLIISILGLLAIIIPAPLDAASWDEVSRSGGGGVGHYIRFVLARMIGLTDWGTFPLLLILGLIGAMLAFDISIRQVVGAAVLVGTTVRSLVQRARSRRELVIRTPGEESGVGRARRLPAVQGEILPRAKGEEEAAVEEVEGEVEEGAEAPYPRIIGRTERQAAIDMVAPASGEWQMPPLDLLEPAGEAEISQAEIRRRARVIEETLASFNVQARVVEVNCGPTVTQFALQPGTGVKVAKITALANDLALALSASSIRIEAPVPGRPVVGIEIPNTAISLVALREILESQTFREHKGALKVALGRDVSGQPVVDDLTKMPHLLIAGTTGSGKSVCINALVVSFLYQHSPDSLRFIMIDPKRVELSIFHDIPHLAFPVVTEINGRRAGQTQGDQVDALKALYWATQEMERRYRVFSREGFRNITGYNKAARAEANPNLPPMPYIVLVIDELADLMMVAPEEAETMICRLAQLARATGIHLVLATQRPSVDVVTGLIKANFPSRVSFAVSSSVDSRVVLDMIGAEQLLGRGDALYMAPDSAKPIRIQGSYVSDEEIERVVAFWKEQWPRERAPAQPVQLPMPLSWREETEEEPEDELLPEAIALVRKHNRASAALLQRRLRVSFNRASRLIDLLEQKGIVGPEEQGRSREVLMGEEE